MEELAQKMKARMAFDAAGVSATIEPGGKLTVRVAKAATVPVTGLCTPGAEAYAGQQISYLRLADGQSITLSLADCNPDFVAAPDRRRRRPAAPRGPDRRRQLSDDGHRRRGRGGGTGGAGGDHHGWASAPTPAPTRRTATAGRLQLRACRAAPPGAGAAAGAVAGWWLAAAAPAARAGDQASWAMRPSFSGRSIR